jgi:YD repeat-containing protein
VVGTSGASPNAVYLNLTDRPIKDSEEVADGIVVDYDDAGRLVGIEIPDASERTADPTALKQFSFEEA